MLTADAVIKKLHDKLEDDIMLKEEIRERLAEIVQNMKEREARANFFILNVERFYSQCKHAEEAST